MEKKKRLATKNSILARLSLKKKTFLDDNNSNNRENLLLPELPYMKYLTTGQPLRK